MVGDGACGGAWWMARFLGSMVAFATVFGSLPAMFVMRLNRAKLENGLCTEDCLTAYQTEYPYPLILMNGTTMENRVKDTLGASVQYYFCLFIFFPLALRFYLGHKCFPCKAMIAAVLFSFSAMFVGYGVLGSKLMQLASPCYTLVFTFAALKFTLPADSRVTKVMTSLLMILVGGMCCMIVGMATIARGDNSELLFYIVALPLGRETSRMLATKCTWYLFSEARVGGYGVTSLIRKNSWIFVVWLMIFWSTYYRLALANLASVQQTYFMVVFQAVLEVALRKTLLRRKRFFHRVKLRITKSISKFGVSVGSRNTVVEPMSMKIVVARNDLQAGPKVQRSLPGENTKRDLARCKFYSMIILMEMMSEYAGITNSALTLIYWADKPISYPFNWYTLNALGHARPDLTSVYSTAGLSYFMEILVDFICLSCEGELDTISIWRNLNKWSCALMFMMASWYGYVLSIAVFILGDDIKACRGKDICYCVGHGLVRGGPREGYCLMIYPNATWTESPPVLGPHVLDLES